MDGNIRLTDFGYAATASTSRMKLGPDGRAMVRTMLGTWIYMAPEVSEKREMHSDEAQEPYFYDPALADAYGLGVLTFVMITKRHPFDYFAVTSRHAYYYLQSLWRSACEDDRRKYWQFFEGKSKTRHIRLEVYEPHRSFIEDTMCLDPEKRTTVKEAVRSHRFFAPNAEYVSPARLATLYGSKLRERLEGCEVLESGQDAAYEAKHLNAYKPSGGDDSVSPEQSIETVRAVETTRDELCEEDVHMRARTAITTPTVWESLPSRSLRNRSTGYALDQDTDEEG
eukprot:scaffold1616_cov310-Pinguiococcus_pyrenoidosus.AAC.27